MPLRMKMISIDVSNQLRFGNVPTTKGEVSVDESTNSMDSWSSVSSSSSWSDLNPTQLSDRSMSLECHGQWKPHRSIFNEFWQKHGGGCNIRRFVVPNAAENPADSPAEQSVSYEETIKKNEEVMLDSLSENRSCLPTRRRIFFLSESESEPSICQMALERSNDIRKIQSTSGLERRRKPKTSCLRKGRFSGHGSELIAQSSVSFHNEISVRLYERPKEVHSHEGWSSYFS